MACHSGYAIDRLGCLEESCSPPSRSLYACFHMKHTLHCHCADELWSDKMAGKWPDAWCSCTGQLETWGSGARKKMFKHR